MYWHLQMFLPDGREGDAIDSSLMLREPNPVIGTGEWDNEQCRKFKNEDGEGIQNGDIVLVREGARVLALCRVLSDSFRSEELHQRYGNHHFRSVEIIDWYSGGEGFPQVQGTLKKLINERSDSYRFIQSWLNAIGMENTYNTALNAVEYKKQIILQGPPGTGKTKLAKELAYELISGSKPNGNDVAGYLKSSDQFKLIQFHPSYTYEDFIRGIQAKPVEGGGVEFVTVDKVFAEIAEIAQLATKVESNSGTVTLEERYINYLTEIIREDLKEKSINVDPLIVKYVEPTRLVLSHAKYSKDAGGFGINNVVLKREISYLLNDDRGESKYPLYPKMMEPLLELLKKYLQDYPIEEFSRNEMQAEKAYVLVIDEINRANLSSVLGELIYGLEYRGEPVNLIYAKDGNTELVIPPNLYIIGTMNTADRSVGAIDYAIRRRFVFESVLPDRNAITDPLAKGLFEKVESFFDEGYLSQEFEKRDVQLGHSYFIAKSPEELRIKLKSEIKPILREYIKDGILLRSAEEKIESLAVE